LEVVYLIPLSERPQAELGLLFCASREREAEGEAEKQE